MMRWHRGVHATVLWLSAILLLGGAADQPRKETFDEKLDRVDAAIRTNPSHVLSQAIDSCVRRRRIAIRLYEIHEFARAGRALDHCLQLLRVPERPPQAREAGLTIEEIQARAARELEQALLLEADLERGLEIYRGCASCHMPEGAGLSSGLVPQIAGQHRRVVIKQLADIRAGNRETVVMAPYATVEMIGGVQAVADVAGYIATLEISTDVGRGPGDQLELGEELYRENCARCHGETGEGDPEIFAPRIHSQHFAYLERQFERIRSGKRRNANAEMRAQIEQLDEAQTRAILDYVSRLEPPPELQAPPDWRNPDFAW